MTSLYGKLWHWRQDQEDASRRSEHEEWLRGFHTRCDRAQAQAVREVRLAFCYAFPGDDFKERLVELGAYIEGENVGTLLVSMEAYRMAERQIDDFAIARGMRRFL